MLYGMMWVSVWGGCFFARPGVILNVYLLITLWRGAGSRGTVTDGCCVLPIRCGGSGVFTLGSCTGGGDGACDTAILNTFRSNSKSSLLSFSLGYRQSFNSENPQFV